MKKFLLLVLLAALAGGAWYFYKGGEGDAPQYQTVVIARGELTQVVTATGTLNPVLNVQVGCQISGNIQKLLVDFNSEVKAGQIVAQLDPATYEAAVSLAEGDLANAKAALALAEVNARRDTELLKNKLTPQADHDAVLAALAQAGALVRMKEASLKKATVDLARCTIVSPIDGIVISRDVDVGQTVAATMNAPVLFKIANDLRKMQINAAVAEADIGNLEVGQNVEFTVDAFPLRTFHGQVVQVRNAATTVQNVVTYDTVISVSNDDLKLKPGMTANVSTIIAQRQGVLKIPNAALRFRPPESATAQTPAPSAEASGGGARPQRPGGGGRQHEKRSMSRTVQLFVGGKLQPAQLKVGISDGVNTELLEGAKEGDAVVTGMIQKTPAPPTAGASSPLGGGRRPF